MQLPLSTGQLPVSFQGRTGKAITLNLVPNTHSTGPTFHSVSVILPEGSKSRPTLRPNRHFLRVSQLSISEIGSPTLTRTGFSNEINILKLFSTFLMLLNPKSSAVRCFAQSSVVIGCLAGSHAGTEATAQTWSLPLVLSHINPRGSGVAQGSPDALCLCCCISA